MTASEMGKIGRARNTQAQQDAARANGRKGGAPKRYCMPCDRWVYRKVCRYCGADTDKADPS